MKKAFAKIIIVVLFIVGLTGCGRNDRIERHEERRLKCVERWEDCSIFVDTETGIGYLVRSDSGGTAITVMFDTDGEIYRPEGWKDYGE